MKNFLILYHSPASAMEMMAKVTPEQREAGMKVWMDWKDALGDKLIEMGSPLMPGHEMTTDKTLSTSNSEISGYSIITAEDINHAKELLKGHPHFGWAEGCKIEIHEFAEM